MPNYYRVLLTRARQQPRLQLAPKPSPEDGLGWKELPVAQLAVAAMDNGVTSGELTTEHEVVVMEEDREDEVVMEEDWEDDGDDKADSELVM